MSGLIVRARAAIRIVVVGAGASGTLAALRLIEAHHRGAPMHVTLIEADEAQLARGIAYRDGSTLCPLNVIAMGMSAYEEKPLHFVDWLAARAAGDARYAFAPDDFVPRPHFGEYLRAELERARRNAPHVLDVVVDEAIDIVRYEGAHSVRLASGRTLRADAVVLAVGHGRSHTAVDAPFAPHALDGVEDDDDVLFIGTGLTTIDHLLVLDGRGHRGRCFAVSRRGLWPRPHATFTRTAIAPERVRARTATARAALRFVRDEIAMQDVPWQSVIDALRPHVASIWMGFDDLERRRFVAHLRAHWEVHRHRVPERSLRVIERLRAEGRLESVAGRVLETVPRGPRGFTTRIHERRTATERRIESQAVIRCTGPISDYRVVDHPLIRALVARGTLVPDTLGLGALTDDDGRVLGRDGVQAGLFTLGPPRRASLYESTGLPEIRRQASSLARVLEREHPERDGHGPAIEALEGE